MDWDSYCQEYVERKHDRTWIDFTKELASRIRKEYLQKNIKLDTEWFEKALEDEKRKWFVALVIRTIGSVPKKLFPAMIRAAVYEVDPSSNRAFIQPCLDTYGLRPVNEALLEYLESGSDFEKAGAVNALYWASARLSYSADSPAFTIEYATSETRAAYEALEDIWMRRRQLILKEFVNNEDLHVRRSIIPALKLDESFYPDELKPLVKKAIEVASSHPDEYIRHRLQIHLGKSNTYPALPHREKSKRD